MGLADLMHVSQPVGRLPCVGVVVSASSAGVLFRLPGLDRVWGPVPFSHAYTDQPASTDLHRHVVALPAAGDACLVVWTDPAVNARASRRMQSDAWVVGWWTP